MQQINIAVVQKQKRNKHDKSHSVKETLQQKRSGAKKLTKNEECEINLKRAAQKK